MFEEFLGLVNLPRVLAWCNKFLKMTVFLNYQLPNVTIGSWLWTNNYHRDFRVEMISEDSRDDGFE